jgi:hypothetical protein
MSRFRKWRIKMQGAGPILARDEKRSTDFLLLLQDAPDGSSSTNKNNIAHAPSRTGGFVWKGHIP